jgi:DNA polymerase-3 subunit alpha
MEFGPVLSEDEALIKKSSSSEEYDKIRINRSGGEEGRRNYSASKSVGRNLKHEYMPVGLYIRQVILLILFLWLPSLYVTQFDNSVVETAGLLKMDFLGLKTLTLIKDTVKLVKYRNGIDLDPDTSYR